MPAISAFIPASLFVIIVIFLGVGLTKDPHKLPSTLIDRPMPEFELTEIAPGEPVLDRGDLEKGLALVNVFGSWCRSCVIEHPTLMRLSREQSIPIYGVDWRDKPGDGKAWLDRFGDPYARVGVDGDSVLAINLGVTGAPETFIVDSSGQIRYKHIGPITDDVWDEVIEPVLANLAQEEE